MIKHWSGDSGVGHLLSDLGKKKQNEQETPSIITYGEIGAMDKTG